MCARALRSSVRVRRAVTRRDGCRVCGSPPDSDPGEGAVRVRGSRKARWTTKVRSTAAMSSGNDTPLRRQLGRQWAASCNRKHSRGADVRTDALSSALMPAALQHATGNTMCPSSVRCLFSIHHTTLWNALLGHWAPGGAGRPHGVLDMLRRRRHACELVHRLGRRGRTDVLWSRPLPSRGVYAGRVGPGGRDLNSRWLDFGRGPDSRAAGLGVD
jgi:hypothetical protein